MLSELTDEEIDIMMIVNVKSAFFVENLVERTRELSFIGDGLNDPSKGN